MNQELKTKWIAALRSGDYKQTRSVLKDDQGYCCLGVLCEISGQGTFDTFNKHLFTDKEGDTKCANLTPTLRTFSNILPLEEGQLTNMNDRGVSFTEIADWIETNL